MPSLHRYNGSSWVQVPNGEAVQFYSGGWNAAKNLQYHDGSDWQIVWQKSDPVTYNFYASDDVAYRTSGWRSELRVGSYGFGDHMSFFKFTDTSAYAIDDNGALTTNKTLSSALSDRGTVTSAKLHLYRDTGGYGTIPSGAAPYYIGHNTGGFNTGTPVFDTSHQSTLAVGGWAADTGREATLDVDIIDEVKDGKAIVVGNVNNVSSLTYPGGNDTNYSALYDNTDTSFYILTYFKRPRLEVTLDY